MKRHCSSCSSRIDYERSLAVPYGQRDFRLDRMRELLARVGQPANGPADRPRRRHQGQRLDGGHDRRRALGRRISHRTVQLAPPATASERIAMVDGAALPERRVGPIWSRRCNRSWPRWTRRPRRRINGRTGPTYLRDHHGPGPAALRPPEGASAAVLEVGLGRPARFDQRLPAAGLGDHQHQLRPHAVARQHAGRRSPAKRPASSSPVSRSSAA